MLECFIIIDFQLHEKRGGLGWILYWPGYEHLSIDHSGANTIFYKLGKQEKDTHTHTQNNPWINVASYYET